MVGSGLILVRAGKCDPPFSAVRRLARDESVPYYPGHDAANSCGDHAKGRQGKWSFRRFKIDGQQRKPTQGREQQTTQEPAEAPPVSKLQHHYLADERSDATDDGKNVTHDYQTILSP